MIDRKQSIQKALIVLLSVVLTMLFGYAKFVLRLFDTAGRTQETATSAHDAPERILFGGVAQRGKHVLLYASRQQTGAAALVGFADGVLEYYAGQLDVEASREPIRVYLLDTQAEYERADALYNMGTTRRNLGFARHGNVFLYVRSRPGQPITEDSITAFELAHELCHAIHQKVYPSYDWQPSWLLEGVASTWAEQAILHTHSLNANKLLSISTPFILLRRELANNRPPSVAEVLAAPKRNYGNTDASQLSVTYAKPFALIRMLDDSAPVNTERRARFRSFLKQINMLDASMTVQETSRRFDLLFGGPRLAALQNDYIHYIQTTKPCPWEMYWCDMRLQEDGTIVAEARSGQTAAVFHEQATRSAFRLSTQVDVAPVGDQQADLMFGRTVNDGFHVLYYRPGYIGLLKYKDGWTTLAICRVSPLLFAPGQHTLEANIKPNQVEARLDGKTICTFEATDRPFHAGQWGVGCYDSHITFSNISAQPIIADEKTPLVAHVMTFVPVHTTR